MNIQLKIVLLTLLIASCSALQAGSAPDVEYYGASSDAERSLPFSEVVKCTVFLADIDEWAAMNEVYIEFFQVKPPARSALGVSGLALGARTEIECIATISG